MLRALVIVAAMASAAPADTLYTCKALPPTAKVKINLAPGTSLADVATWVMGFTCKNIVFPTDLKVRVTIVSPNEVTAKEAYQLFLDAMPAYGVVVKEHDNNVILTDAHPCGVTGADPELAKGIHRVDDQHTTISRALVDKLLADTTDLARSARVVPSIRDGKASGFKLYAIRPNSVYALVGLQNGDTVTAVNGLDITTPDKALEAYTKLKDANALRLDILRRGQPTTLEITIVQP